MAVPKPEDYDIHPLYGFVPENPATNLPEYFEPWMTFGAKAAEYVNDKTIRQNMKELPLLDHNKLSGDVRELRLAHLILSGIANCFIWVDGPEGIPEVLPRQVAIPLKGVADRLKIPPCLVYHTAILSNWKIKDPYQDFVLENMETIFNFIGGEKESWFLLSSVPVEVIATKGLYAVVDAQEMVKEGDAPLLASNLVELESCLNDMKDGLERFYEGCEPEFFYRRIKPFLNGWDTEPFHKKGPKGIVFEGVSDEQVGCIPLTAAQTSSLAVFDAALGIKHKPKEETHRLNWRRNMPPDHVNFMLAVEKGPSIRDFVLSCGDENCKESFNRCVQALAAFRSKHVQNVTSYVVNPGWEKASETGDSEEIRKTSERNREILDFLKGMRDSTGPQLE